MRKLTARAVPCKIPGYPDYLAALLCARGIKDARAAELFLNPDVGQLNDPFLMKDMDKAVNLIKGAREKGQVVAVYGDYDADGVCASAILLEALKIFGVNAFSYIPSRLTEGYGLNLDAISLLSQQAALLISVDCGITAVEEVAEARKAGMQVILTDHHTLPPELPEADALLHPQLGDYPEKSLCGAGVAWKLACALLGFDGAKSSLELAALATVADMVPLRGENRVIVSLGLKEMKRTKRPGLKALLRVSGIKEDVDVQSDHVGFQLAPRLNAGGRLSTAQQALNLLLTESDEEAEQLAAGLQQLNQERREVEQTVMREAAAQLAGLDLSQTRTLVLAGEDWNPGVVGLIAGKLAERWNYPSIVLTGNGEDFTGSGRSAGSINLHEALSDCKEVLSRFGGHKMAAGLALQRENLDAFRELFDRAVRKQLKEEDLIPETDYDTVLPLSEVSLGTIEKLDKLAPFGLDNPAPVFLMEDLKVVSSRAVGADSSHLKLTLGQNGAVREGIAFGQGRIRDGLSKEISIVSGVDKNEFNGRVSAQLKVKAILPGQQAYGQDPLLQSRALISALDGQGEGEMPELLKALPKIQGTRGTLLLAYTPETANELHRLYPELQTYMGSATDPRSFNAIVFAPDFNRFFARFERLVFADGLPGVYTKMLAEKATGASRVDALPQSPELKALLLEISPSMDELRHAYQQLKSGVIMGFLDSPGRELAALKVLAQLELITLNENGTFAQMLPVKRISPENSTLFRNLTA